MKAIRIHAHGGPEVLQFEELPSPLPLPGQSLIRVSAAGVNFKDVYQRTGSEPTSTPFIPGVEGSGVVESSARWPIGTRVAWVSPGSYAEQTVVPDSKLIALPDGLDYAHGAAALLHGMTAQYLTESTYRVSEGDVVLVHAGAGGVGLLLIQLLKHKGATVLTTVSTPDKALLAKAAGADVVILYEQTDFVEAVKAATGGKGVHVVYDSVGRTTFKGSLSIIRPLGTLALFGHSSGLVAPVDPMDLMRAGSVSLVRPTLAHYIVDEPSLHARANKVLNWIEDGVLELQIGHRYKLANAAQAHRDLESRVTTGKLVIEIA